MPINEDQPNAAVRGALANQVVTVISGKWIGAQALELNYNAHEFVHSQKRLADCILAIVESLEKDQRRVHHVRRSFQYVPDFFELLMSPGGPTR